jgi:lysophospholipase L1-like esterase
MADKFHKLMLVGDSMIEFFDWQARFPDREVKNLGRSGESVEELRTRASTIVENHEAPDLVLVMIGTNNVAMENFNFQCAYADILDTFKNAYPEATLVVNSLLPMRLNYLAPDTVARVNSSLKSLAASADALYLDVWAAMVDNNGAPLEDVLEDEVHLSYHGYKLWGEQLEKFLES